ncbi:MAG: Rnase Y domain-containing protein, partial [Muribaculaceae bacterium]|nr:Rnase Y domain-containing protein [Muribaculaceae bacterium]
MDNFIIYAGIAIIALAIGVVAAIIVQRKMAQSRARLIIDEATREADALKKNRLLEAREEELKIKAEAEKAANQRMSKVQSAEAKQKQRELQL